MQATRLNNQGGWHLDADAAGATAATGRCSSQGPTAAASGLPAVPYDQTDAGEPRTAAELPGGGPVQRYRGGYGGMQNRAPK